MGIVEPQPKACPYNWIIPEEVMYDPLGGAAGSSRASGRQGRVGGMSRPRMIVEWAWHPQPAAWEHGAGCCCCGSARLWILQESFRSTQISPRTFGDGSNQSE